MADEKKRTGLVLTVLGVVLCLSCVGFVLLAGLMGPEGVGSEEWQRAFHRDGGVDAGG